MPHPRYDVTPAGVAAPRRVIITRPALEAGDWVQQLQHQGFAAESLPLMDIAAASGIADVQAIQQAWQHIENYAACMFVSGNAVRFFFENFEQKKALAQNLLGPIAINTIANKAVKLLPPHLRFMAPGPGTAAALLAAGVPAGQIDSPPLDAGQFDSEALWKVVGQRDWQGRRVLVVRGATSPLGQTSQTPAVSSGRDWLAQQWLAAGCQVDLVGVYERRACVFTPEQAQRAQRASRDGAVWLFSSSEAVQHLLGQAALQGTDWRRAVAIATHPRIAETVRAAGWGVVLPARPALGDVVSALHALGAWAAEGVQAKIGPSAASF